MSGPGLTDQERLRLEATHSSGQVGCNHAGGPGHCSVVREVESLLAVRGVSSAQADDDLRAAVEALCSAAMKGNTHRGTLGNYVSVHDLRAAASPAPTDGADQ